MESMTGFGNRTDSIGEYQVTVLVKSVNNKGLSLHFRMAKNVAHLEKQLYEKARSVFLRGRIDVTISVESNSGGIKPEPDSTLVKAYIDSANRIAKEHSLTSNLNAFDVISLPGIMRVPDPSVIKGFDNEVVRVVEKALQSLLDSRREEGMGLATVFETNMKKIIELAEPVFREHKKRLEHLFNERKKRVSELLEDAELDENRLAGELAILSDRIDISEEHQRLLAHIESGLKVLKDNNTGRKLGFILQEMHRELNTMGSKVDNAEAIHQVIEMKELLGELREQVANVQ